MPLQDQAPLLFQIYRRPLSAMSALIDHGSWLFALVCLLAVSLLFSIGPTRGREIRAALERPIITAGDIPGGAEGQLQPSPWLALSPGQQSFYTPALLLAMLFVPGVIVAMKLFGEQGSLSTLIERDFGALFTCVAMGWTAVHLPIWLLEFAPMPPEAFFLLWVFRLVLFAALAMCAVRVLYGASYTASTSAVIAGIGALLGGLLFFGVFGFLLRYLASPFFLYYAYRYFGSDVQSLGQGFRNRQNFKRALEAASVNPHDADAQYQLGLVYAQRRQIGEATARFKEAIRIDPREADAYFQLGRIANEQGRSQEALDLLQKTVDLSPNHASYEVWRELGQAHLALDHVPEARQILAYYAEHRPYDPEGLYLYGEALRRAGEPATAATAYRQVIEAVKTAPPYRRRALKKWSRLAEKAL